jgi:hypothetical protein
VRCLIILAALALLAGCAAPAAPGIGASDGPAPPHGAAGLRPGPAMLPFLQAASVSDGAEPSILADRNGKHVWIGDTSGGYVSDDNGTTWAPLPSLALGVHALADGWGLAQDEAGRLYAADLTENHIDVGRSDDGRAWAQKTYAVGVFDSVDRPWLAAGKPGEVALFYVAAVGILVGPDEHCARSTDGGATYTDQRPLGAAPQGGKAFADSQGRVYFVNDNGILYRFATCLGGATQIKMLEPSAINNMIQADASGTDLYMAAATGDGAITLAGSHDGGAVKTLDVSPPTLHTNTFATVSAWGDEVAVAWYGSEAQGDPGADTFQGDFNVELAIVHDFWGTPTVTVTRLTDSPNHNGPICMGGIGCTGNRGLLDYFMIDHDKWGGLHVAYVDDTGQNGPTGVRYVHVPPANATVTTTVGGPVARFSATMTGNRLETDASSSGPGNLTYAWDWGDGATGSGVWASHEYTDLGAFQVTLTVRDESGRIGTRTQGFIPDGAPAKQPAGSGTSTAPPPSPSSTPTQSAPTTSAPGFVRHTGTHKASPAWDLLPVGLGLLAAAWGSRRR